MIATAQRSRAPARRIPATRDEAAAAVERLALVRSAIASRAARLDADIQAQAAADCEALVAEVGELEEIIRVYCEAHRAALTRDGRVKTVKFGAGSVSWRLRPASIEITDPVTALASLRAKGLESCIRSVEAVDKSALTRAGASVGLVGLLGSLDGLRYVPGAEDCVVKTDRVGG